jgi:hypothetical protein
VLVKTESKKGDDTEVKDTFEIEIGNFSNIIYKGRKIRCELGDVNFCAHCGDNNTAPIFLTDSMDYMSLPPFFQGLRIQLDKTASYLWTNLNTQITSSISPIHKQAEEKYGHVSFNTAIIYDSIQQQKVNRLNNKTIICAASKKRVALMVEQFHHLQEKGIKKFSHKKYTEAILYCDSAADFYDKQKLWGMVDVNLSSRVRENSYDSIKKQNQLAKEEAESEILSIHHIARAKQDAKIKKEGDKSRKNSSRVAEHKAEQNIKNQSEIRLQRRDDQIEKILRRDDSLVRSKKSIFYNSIYVYSSKD